MLVTYKWLQDYIDIPLSVNDLATRMTDIGLEVKTVEPNPRDSQDTLIEAEVTPNRSDCLSMFGVARELAAATGWKLRKPNSKFAEDSVSSASLASVKIEDPDLCMRYCGRVVRGIKIGPSPKWMQDRLEAVGIRAINNVVDITNYVLMELGHPLHAFDLNKVNGKQIIVRRAKVGETMMTLDNQGRKLDPERLVIADAKCPVALAGVMGGLDSEVTSETVDLLIESACFNPISIRRTSKCLGLRSESSYRFERGTSPDNAVMALERCVALICELADGKAAAGMIDCYPTPYKPNQVSVRLSRINEVLALNVDTKTVTTIFERMGLTIVKADENCITVTVPSHRRDLEREIDLIEEVCRLHGLEKTPVTRPMIAIQANRPYPLEKIDRVSHEVLVNEGFWEAMNYSFIHSEVWKGYGFDVDQMIPLRNPMSSEQDVLRCSLLPGLMGNVARNMDQGQAITRFFEMGRVMRKSGKDGFCEETVLAVIASGKNVGAVWEEKGLTMDFYTIKGLVSYLFKRFELPAPEFKPADVFYYKQGVAAQIMSKGSIVGTIGQVCPKLAAKLGVDKDVFYFELVSEAMASLPSTTYAYRGLPKFPAVTRDISLLVPVELSAEQIKDAIWKQATELAESVELFDLYMGNRLPEGTRSVSFRITYRHSDRTLQDSEVETVHQRIVKDLEENYKAVLRKA